MKKFMSFALALLLVSLAIPSLAFSAAAEEGVNPDDYLVAHWDFDESHTYTDTMLRVNDIAAKGSFPDLVSAQGGSTVSNGIGTVSKNQGNVFVSYRNSNAAVDCTNFAAMTTLIRMRVNDPYQYSNSYSGDFFDISKDSIYMIRCLFATTTTNNTPEEVTSFKFQYITLSTAAQGGGNRTWGNSDVVTCPSGKWFFFAFTHYFNAEKKSVVSVYFSVDGTEFQCIGTSVSPNAFTDEQIAAATTNPPSLQNITIGKNQYNSYAAQNWGYSFDDIRIYKTVLGTNGLKQAAEGVLAKTRLIGYQLSKAYADAKSNQVYDLRLIAEISSNQVETAGFHISVDTGAGAVSVSDELTKVTCCYSSLLGKDNAGEILVYNANTDKYLIALTIQGIPVTVEPSFTVSSYYTDNEGTQVSLEKTFSITSAQLLE